MLYKQITGIFGRYSLVLVYFFCFNLSILSNREAKFWLMFSKFVENLSFVEESRERLFPIWTDSCDWTVSSSTKLLLKSAACWCKLQALHPDNDLRQCCIERLTPFYSA